MFTTHQNRLFRWLRPLFAVPLFASLAAQEVPEDDDVYVLPSFTVETGQDRGYRSTNAISGTSLNISLRDLPQSVSVINQEFIEDQQATNLNEALAFEAGVSTEEFTIQGGANVLTSGNFLPRESSPSSVANAGQRGTNAISIRGFAVPNQQRHGFRIGNVFIGRRGSIVLGGNTDTSNTSRVEVVRGPASLLYGLNVLSGVVNIVPKEPLDVFRGHASVGIGSDGFFRSTLDLTGPIIKDVLNYRVIGAYQEEDSWIRYTRSEGEYLTAQFSLRPFKNDKLVLLVEGMAANEEDYGIDFMRFTASNGGNSELFRNKWGEPAAFGYDFLREEAEYHGFTPKDNPPPSVGNSFGSYRFDPIGNDYRISGPDTFQKREERTVLALLRLRPLENLSIELGGFYSEIEQRERLLAEGVFSNQEGGVAILPATVGDPNEGRTVLQADRVIRRGSSTIVQVFNPWLRNPEVGLVQRDDFDTIVEDQDFFNTGDIAVGFGPGEKFRIFNLATLTSKDRELAAIRDQFNINDSLDVHDLLVNDPATYQAFVDAILQGIDDREIDSNLRPIVDNRQFARYYWYENPESAESMQLRARVNYAIETDLPAIGMARHVITGGVSYIKDNVSMIVGVPSVITTYSNPTTSVAKTGFNGALLSSDPYIIRESVFDTSPIRYNGEALALAGGATAFQLGPITANDSYILRSGWIDSEVTYESYYGIYQGTYLNGDLNIIGGYRSDTYDVKEAERLRIVMPNSHLFGQDDPLGYLQSINSSGIATTGGTNQVFLDRFAGYGDKPYSPDPLLPDALNAKVAEDIESLRSELPDGTRTNLFDEPPSFNTGTFGFTYKIIEPLSLQFVFSEGVFPNTGQRDGAFDPIPAEQSKSYEMGLKFDFFDGEISGRISYYRIERENAVFYWDWAPRPSAWVGNEESGLNAGMRMAFDPNIAKFQPTAFEGFGRDHLVGIAHAPQELYFRRALEDFASEDGPWAQSVTPELRQEILSALETAAAQGRQAPFYTDPIYAKLGAAGELGPGSTGPEDGQTARDLAGLPGKPFAANTTFIFVRINGENGVLNNPNNQQVDGVEVGNVVKHALDLAVGDRNADNYPFLWMTNGTLESDNINHTGLNRGANVTFEEEVDGVDGQIFWTPSNSYQAIFTFSYQQRKVAGNGLNLVSTADPVTGELLGSGYEPWVWILGAENFADPRDPTTYDGTGSVGVDLSGVPNLQLSLWNKYAFLEGDLKGFELAGGISYFGEADTFPAIGGKDFSLNRFPTPPSAEQYRVDLAASYSFEWLNLEWRLALKINNLLNDQIWESEASYYDELTDREVFRRHRDINAPRNYRFTVTTSF